MTYDDDDIAEEDKLPGSEVTPELFQHWQNARRGRTPAEDMTNPVWQWLFRGRMDPYHAHEHFQQTLGLSTDTFDSPNQPRWAGCRMGQSRTELPDGRVFWIAGEHEDYYDPDFFIYNDVIVQSPDGDVRIFGYPESTFQPTDFHSATAINDGLEILIIGSIGYSGSRDPSSTPIHSLNTETLAIQRLESSGTPPGWISRHTAKLSKENHSILIRGGEIETADGQVENIDDWSLSLPDLTWTRLTMRRWIRFRVSRCDGQFLHLWQYSTHQLSLEHPEIGLNGGMDLSEELGADPDMESYRSLFTPPLAHSPVGQSADGEDWKTHRICIDEIIVRYNDEMTFVNVTIEGELPTAAIQSLAEDLRSKLARVENSECQLDWIENV